MVGKNKGPVVIPEVSGPGNKCQGLSGEPVLLPCGSESPSNFLKITELIGDGPRNQVQGILCQSSSRRKELLVKFLGTLDSRIHGRPSSPTVKETDPGDGCSRPE